MARGRMLNRSVCDSKKFHDLPSDTCRLFATWIIPYLDIRGVFQADPIFVRSKVFPRREDVTSDMVRGYLDAMEAVGLIARFECNGETWQHWPGFEHNQIGIRYDRESSDFPIPPGWEPPKQLELVPPNDGQNPAEEKLKEVKKKGKGKGADAPDPPRHPAIDVYRSKARRFPDRAQWPAIERGIGTDEKSLERWGKTVEAYILCGWNKVNIGGMLEWYGRGELPHVKRMGGGNGRGTSDHAPSHNGNNDPNYADLEYLRLNPKGKGRQDAIERLKARGYDVAHLPA